MIDKKGFSSIEFVLITTAIIIFIVVPLFLYMIEKIVVVMLIDAFKYAVDQSFLSIYRSIDISSFSTSRIEIEDEQYIHAFKALLKKNIRLGKNPIIKDYTIKKVVLEDGQDNEGKVYAVVTFEMELTMESLYRLLRKSFKYNCVWRKEIPIDW